MSLFRRTHAEMAGAWRSLRYDLGRRPVEPPPGQDPTSTGMSTFAVEIPDEPPTGAADARRPRRAAAVIALGLLTAAGTAGAYLAVANGLGPALPETPAAADALPRPAAPPAAVAAPAPNAGIGRGTAATVARGTVPAAGTVPADGNPPARPRGRTALTTGRGTAAAPVPAAPHGGPATARTAHPPTTACDCPQPPVPTPTAPTTSPSPTPSTDPTPTGSADPSPAASAVSPVPSDSTQSWQDRHYR